jgi:hypothetical protein
LTQFSQIKRKEVESIDEFNTRFNTLIKEFPNDFRPRTQAIHLQCVHSFEGQLVLILRDKFPNTLREAQEWASKIETNLIVSKIKSCPKEMSKGNSTLIEQNCLGNNDAI